jgi:hypothetical protein
MVSRTSTRPQVDSAVGRAPGASANQRKRNCSSNSPQRRSRRQCNSLRGCSPSGGNGRTGTAQVTAGTSPEPWWSAPGGGCAVADKSGGRSRRDNARCSARSPRRSRRRPRGRRSGVCSAGGACLRSRPARERVVQPRSPGRRPQPPPESATGTGRFVHATAHHSETSHRPTNEASLGPPR